MWDLLKSGWDFLKGTDASGTSNLMKGLGMGGALWSAYNQNKTAKKYMDMQKDAFDYNKMLSEEERKRRDRAESSLASAYNSSSYGA